MDALRSELHIIWANFIEMPLDQQIALGLILLALCLPPIPNWSLAFLEEKYGPTHSLQVPVIPLK